MINQSVNKYKRGIIEEKFRKKKKMTDRDGERKRDPCKI